jgi:hypothetical protein
MALKQSAPFVERGLDDSRPAGEHPLAKHPAAHERVPFRVGGHDVGRLRARNGEGGTVHEESRRLVRHPVSQRIGGIDPDTQHAAGDEEVGVSHARGHIPDREAERGQRQVGRPVHGDEGAAAGRSR